MQKSKTLWEWLTNRFVINVRAEENFELKWSIKFSNASFLLVIVLALAFVSTVNFYLYDWFSSNSTKQAKAEKAIKSKLWELQVQIDSLEKELNRRDQMLHAFKKIMQP